MDWAGAAIAASYPTRRLDGRERLLDWHEEQGSISIVESDCFYYTIIKQACSLWDCWKPRTPVDFAQSLKL